MNQYLHCTIDDSANVFPRAVQGKCSFLLHIEFLHEKEDHDLDKSNSYGSRPYCVLIHSGSHAISYVPQSRECSVPCCRLQNCSLPVAWSTSTSTLQLLATTYIRKCIMHINLVVHIYKIMPKACQFLADWVSHMEVHDQGSPLRFL